MHKKRVFSGVQPTGNLHLGNYLGAIKNFVNLQNKFECIYCVVDLHAITNKQNPKELKFNVLETFNERCRLRDGVFPSPKALLITKAQIDSLKNEQSYYELMRKVYHKLQSWSPAIFFGFNNIINN